MSNGVSINDIIDTTLRRFSVHELAYSEPDVSGIAPHVWEAHEAAKRAMRPRGDVTFEITFKPDIKAFDLVPENDHALNILRALGPGAKITITI